MSEKLDHTTTASVDLLVARSRELAQRTPDTQSSQTILELCEVLESLQGEQAEKRRENFRDAVRGIASAIRNDQVPATIPWAQDIPGTYGSNEALAMEIERANASDPVNITELRQLRQKLKSVDFGNDDIDDAIKRIYYAKLFEKGPSTENILPAGSPSRSIDLAALIVQRILPNGWWTMGCNGENLSEPPVAKVGTWTGDHPKPESAPSPPLTLLSALTLTLIEAAKKDG